MANPSKKKSPVGRVPNKNKNVGKSILPKTPVKDGMSTAAKDKKMSKLKPGDARPSFAAGSMAKDGTYPTMKAKGKDKTARKKSKQGNPFGGK